MATDRRRPARRWGLAALVGATLVATFQPAAPAQAALTGDVTIAGHGYGHGRGLGQWGSYGYATTGASYQDILRHYYGGTVLGTQPNTPVTVQLTAQDGLDLVVTSGAAFTVAGVPVSAGAAARLTARPDGSYLLSTSPACGEPIVWTTPVPDSRVVPTGPPRADTSAMLSLCTPTGTRQYRGELSIIWANNAQRTVNTVRMEDYLRGVVPRESPASWGDAAGGRGIEALKAQAVAARSYAWAENRNGWAKTCDTTSCQVYGGAGMNGSLIEDRRTDAAVAGTADVVLRTASGAVVRAEFSSSSGGYTAGGVFPAVLDEGDSASPYHNWTTKVPASTIARAFGVGELIDIQVTQRNGLGADGGRVRQVQIVGTAKTVTTTGSDVRSKLGLRSDWFSVNGAGSAPPPPPPAAPPAPPPPPPPAPPVQPMIFQASGNVVGATPRPVPFGAPGDVPLACDWNGDGVSTLGVFRRGVFHVTDVPGGGVAETVFGFGQAGDQPVCGDWDRNGSETVGVYRSGMVFLRNSNTTGIADGQFGFGQRGDQLVAGDWNADGFDTVGVWRSGWFFLTNSNLRPTTDAAVAYGSPGDLPAVGDWDGNGSDTLGIVHAGTFYLRNDWVSGTGQLSFGFGDPGDVPLVGRWSAGTADVVGVARAY